MFGLTLLRRYAAVAILVVAGIAAAQSKTTHRLTIENLIDIKHPSNPVWSPDGKRIAFLWDRADIVNLYVVNADGESKPAALTFFPDGRVTEVFWSRDGSNIYFARGGDLWQVAAAGGAPHAVWTTPSPEVEFSPSPDGSKLAFVRAGSPGEAQHGGDLIVRSLSDGSESEIAHDGESIYSPLWSPDGSQLAYIGGSKIIRHDESPAYSGEKLIYAVFEYSSGQLYVTSLSGGKATAIDTPGEHNGLAWTDSTHLTYDRQSNAYKTRTIYVAPAAGSAPQAIHQDKEDKFWSLPDWEAEAKPKPSPNGKWIAFLTDLDGWDHLYVIPTTGGDAVQITRGISKPGARPGRTTAHGSRLTPTNRIILVIAALASRSSATILCTRASPTSPPAGGRTSRRAGLPMTNVSSTSTPTLRTRRTCSSSLALPEPSLRA